MSQLLTKFSVLGCVVTLGCAGPPPAKELTPASSSEFVGKLEGGIEHGDEMTLHIRGRLSEDGTYEVQTAFAESHALKTIPWKLTGRIAFGTDGATYEDELSTGKAMTRMYGDSLVLELEGTARSTGLPVLLLLMPLEVGEYAYLPPVDVLEADGVACTERADWEARATARYEELVKYGPMLGVVGALIDIGRTGGKLKEIDEEDADRIYEDAMRRCLRARGYQHAGAGPEPREGTTPVLSHSAAWRPAHSVSGRLAR